MSDSWDLDLEVLVDKEELARDTINVRIERLGTCMLQANDAATAGATMARAWLEQNNRTTPATEDLQLCAWENGIVTSPISAGSDDPLP